MRILPVQDSFVLTVDAAELRAIKTALYRLAHLPMSDVEHSPALFHVWRQAQTLVLDIRDSTVVGL